MRIAALVVLLFLIAPAPEAPAARARCKGKLVKVKKRRCVAKARARAVGGYSPWAGLGPAFVAATAAPPAAPPAPGDPPPASDPPPPPPPPPPPAVDPRRLQVRADEFSLVLSQSRVATGDVTVEFTTDGAEDPHDLLVHRADGSGEPFSFGTLQPGQTAVATIKFSAGAYRLICTLDGHEAAGMRAGVTAE